MAEILAVDLSLTATGLAWRNFADRTDGTECLKVPGKGWPRVDAIVRKVRRLSSYANVVVVEGPSLHSQGRGTCDRWALRGAVLYDLWTRGIPFVEVPPAVVKKYATGKGNANKDAMIAAAIRSLGFEGSDNNEADAWCLLHMADQHYHFTDTKPVYRAEMLAKVDWPLL